VSLSKCRNDEETTEIEIEEEMIEKKMIEIVIEEKEEEMTGLIAIETEKETEVVITSAKNVVEAAIEVAIANQNLRRLLRNVLARDRR